MLPLLGCLPLGVVAAFWLRSLPVTVRSEAELAAVGFGWPLAWTVQDQRRYAPQQFPTTVEYVGPKGLADPLVTSVDWVPFAVNSALLWAVACAALVLVAVVRARGRRVRRADASA